MAEGNWRCLFEYTTTFLEECERDKEIQECNKIEYYLERLETVFRCVYRLHEHCAGALMHPGEFLLTDAECTIVRELDSELIALMNTLSSVYIPLWDKNGLKVFACQHLLCMSMLAVPECVEDQKSTWMRTNFCTSKTYNLNGMPLPKCLVSVE